MTHQHLLLKMQRTDFPSFQTAVPTPLLPPLTAAFLLPALCATHEPGQPRCGSAQHTFFWSLPSMQCWPLVQGRAQNHGKAIYVFSGMLPGSWEASSVSTEGAQLGGCEVLAAILQTQGKGCRDKPSKAQKAEPRSRESDPRMMSGPLDPRCEKYAPPRRPGSLSRTLPLLKGV